MRRLYEQERMSLREIGAIHDRSLSMVRRALLMQGVRLRPRHHTLRPSPNRVPHHVMEETITTYRREGSLAKAARALGVSPSTVKRRLVNAGVAQRPRSEVAREAMQAYAVDGDRRAEVIRLYVDEGLSQEQVARRLGMARGTVAKVVRAAGVHRTRGEGVAQAWVRKRAHDGVLSP